MAEWRSIVQFVVQMFTSMTSCSRLAIIIANSIFWLYFFNVEKLFDITHFLPGNLKLVNNVFHDIIWEIKGIPGIFLDS